MVFPNHVFLVNMDLLTAELFWKLYVPQRYVHELERYWKKILSVLRILANL